MRDGIRQARFVDRACALWLCALLGGLVAGALAPPVLRWLFLRCAWLCICAGFARLVKPRTSIFFYLASGGYNPNKPARGSVLDSVSLI